MLAIKNESYQSVTHNWRHDAHVFMTFAFLFFFLMQFYTTNTHALYKAVLIFVGELL